MIVTESTKSLDQQTQLQSLVDWMKCRRAAHYDLFSIKNVLEQHSNEVLNFSSMKSHDRKFA